MSLVKPVIYNDSGELERLQAGDTLDASVTNPEAISLTAGTGGVTIGNPVYLSAANTGTKAKADAAATSKVFAFAKETVAEGVSFNALIDGLVTLTTGQWDAIAGTTGGLAAGTDYFLDNATAGLITSTPPTTGYSLKVIRGVSTTIGLILKERVIKL